MAPETVPLAAGAVAAIAAAFLAVEWRRKKRGEGFQWIMIYALAIFAGGFFIMFSSMSWFLLKGDYSSLILGAVFGLFLMIVGAWRISTEHWTWP